ncbi:MAG: pyridoxine 5'-phosphate synthase [Rudaea sp.]
MTLLSVNVNKIAVLRNSRGGSLPDVCAAAAACIKAGAGGITVHPRPDMRHIHPADTHALGALCANNAEFNIEGNGFAPARGEYPGLLALVERARPTQCTLVPDSDAQVTSDHGFDLRADSQRLRRLVAQLTALGCRVSVFVDADSPDIELAAEIGVSRVEIYTGPYAQAFERGDYAAALDDCVRCAQRAARSGLGVNAGHDLNQENLPALRAAIPGLAEVSIGHALIGEALYAGLVPTVRAYLAILG